MSQNSQRRLAVPLTALFIFGLIYNALVAWLERTHRDQGYKSTLVIAGTLVTILLVAPLIGPRNTARTIAAFAASGTPMTIGSIWRHTRRRRNAQQRAYRLLLGGPNGKVKARKT